MPVFSREERNDGLSKLLCGDDDKGKNTIGLRWPKVLLRYKSQCQESLDVEASLVYKNRRLEEIVFEISCCTECCRRADLMP